CQDGRTNGIMAPSEEAQAHLVRQACRNAGVSPTSIDYVEAHGTRPRWDRPGRSRFRAPTSIDYRAAHGTGAGPGDPPEVGSLAATVGIGRSPDRPCLIGSVKTNIGHLEAASGAASIIKLVLALRHGRIPATLSRAGLNPNIPWAGSGLKVVT